MAYKFFQGTFKTDGVLDVNNAVTGNSLLVDTGGISVTNGNIVASTSQLTASSISASSAQFGSITVPTISSVNSELAGYLDVKGPTRLSGTVALGDDSVDIITVNGQITGSLFAINGGAINDTPIGTTTQRGGKFTTLSASSTLIVVGNTNVTSLSASTGVSSSVGQFGTLIATAVSGGFVDLLADSTVPVWDDTNGRFANSAVVSSFGGLTTLSNGLTVTAGGATVTAGGLTVTAGTSALKATTVTSLSSSGNVTVAGDLQVNGTTTYVNSTNLTVTDKKVVIATGSANAAAADGAGIYVGNDDGGAQEYASLAYDGTNDRWNMKSVSGLHLSGSGQSLLMDGTTVLQQTALFGGAVTGSSVGVGLRLKYSGITTTPFTPALSEYVLGVTTTSTAITISLPPPLISDVGRVLLIKDVTNNAAVNNITITPNGTDTIDGVNASIVLNSNGAAVHCIVVGANKWGLF
jgi:hypothetical protein